MFAAMKAQRLAMTTVTTCDVAFDSFDSQDITLAFLKLCIASHADCVSG